MSNPPTASADPFLELSTRKGANWRTFVVPELRVLFVQVNKNACTSLKWMIAGIAGEDLDAFGPSLEAATSPQDDIHDWAQWKNIPRLSALSAQLRAQIHPDNGWFVFGLTRDPRSRLFSAWQSKLLLENPGYAQFRDESWYPHHPVSPESIAEDFEKFLVHMEGDSGIRGDAHFRDQVDLLHEDLVPYTEIYDIRSIGRMLADLRTHLDSVGYTGEIELPRLNDTPLRANALPFADGVRERIERLYALDFERFGDRWDFTTIEQVPDWTATELAEVDQLAQHGQRLGYLLGEARRYRSESKSLRVETRSLKDQLARLNDRQQHLEQNAEKQRRRVDDLKRKLKEAKAEKGLTPSLRRVARRRARRTVAAVRRRLARD